jgi:hypothetical protein
MKIEFDFRADMTVCELVQYLSDEYEKECFNGGAIASKSNLNDDVVRWKVMAYFERAEKLENLIDDICLKTYQLDVYEV